MILGHCTVSDNLGHQKAYELLAKLYTSATQNPLPAIQKTPLGKPYFQDSPWHFSISHTKNHVFVVLSEENVGIDAEELGREISPKLAEKVLSPAEMAEYEASHDKNRAFLTFWVLKEAAAKLSGRGLKIYPNHTNFTLSDKRVQEIDGCLVAVLTE